MDKLCHLLLVPREFLYLSTHPDEYISGIYMYSLNNISPNYCIINNIIINYSIYKAVY